jgi:multidrug efflux pump subunit AcrA (membrane-fusion protein)
LGRVGPGSFTGHCRISRQLVCARVEAGWRRQRVDRGPARVAPAAAWSGAIHGTLAGTLIWISPDVEDRNATARDSEIRAGTAAADANQSHDFANTSPNAGYVYKAHIRTAKASFLVVGESHAVVSGMTVQADITTEQRRVIDFFLSPVIKYLDEGMKVRWERTS